MHTVTVKHHLHKSSWLSAARLFHVGTCRDFFLGLHLCWSTVRHTTNLLDSRNNLVLFVLELISLGAVKPCRDLSGNMPLSVLRPQLRFVGLSPTALISALLPQTGVHSFSKRHKQNMLMGLTTTRHSSQSMQQFAADVQRCTSMQGKRKAFKGKQRMWQLRPLFCKCSQPPTSKQREVRDKQALLLLLY